MNSECSGFANGLQPCADASKSGGLNVIRIRRVNILGIGNARWHLSNNRQRKILKAMKINQSYKDASVDTGKALSPCQGHLERRWYGVEKGKVCKK